MELGSNEGISVFFPAYNDGGTIASMVFSAILVRQSLTDDYEVIVVKDGSSEYRLYSRLDEVQAAILGAKLRLIDEWNAMRRKQAELYGQSLQEASIIAPAEMEYRKHCYHLSM